jgi:hypothetical protein
VTIVTHEIFKPFVQPEGLDFRLLRGVNIKDLIVQMTGCVAKPGKKGQLAQIIKAYRHTILPDIKKG